MFCFQAEDGIRDLVRSRGLGDVYKRQVGGQVGQRAQGDTRIDAGQCRVFADVIDAGEVDHLSLIHI